MAYIRIYLNDVLMKEIELNESKLTIGRDRNCDIVIDNAGVSSQHAIIEKRGNSFIITDDNSTNGVFVNNKKIKFHTLKYWDEIQIYNYVLKFMAVPGLQGTADPDILQDGIPDQTKTRLVAMSDVKKLVRLREQKKDAFVEMLNTKGDKFRYLLKCVNFKIGKSKDCNLRTSGWLSPRLAAEILRQDDGYYLVPHRRGHVLRNGEPPAKPIKLADGDNLCVRNLSMTFFHRIIVKQKKKSRRSTRNLNRE